MTQNGIVPTSSDKTIQRIFHKFVVCNIKSMTKTKRKEKKKKERKKNKKNCLKSLNTTLWNRGKTIKPKHIWVK